MARGIQNEAVGRRRLRGVAARGANVVALTVQGAKEVPERLWWGLEGLEACICQTACWGSQSCHRQRGHGAKGENVRIQ